MKRSIAIVITTLGLFAVACGDDTTSASTGTGGAGGQGGQGGSATSGTAGAGGMGGMGGAGGMGGGMMSSAKIGPMVDKDLMLSGDIAMEETTTIAPGVTLTLAAGSILHAASGAALVVKGSLVANGQLGAPVVFQSQAHKGADGWTGIKLESGGSATLTRIEIHDAGLAFHAGAGSTYGVDYALVDTSSRLLVLEANGTFGHGTLHALGAAQQQGPIAINSASPNLVDTLVDNANSGVDHIVVNGASSGPTFDHVEVTGCHCAFHFNQGKKITVKNAYVHDNLYGMMVLGSLQTQVVASNFDKNTNNLGTCTGGDVTAIGSYFGSTVFDMSCQGQVNLTPSSTPVADAGPRP